MLLPISADLMPDTVAVLARGFPQRPVTFWEGGLARIQAHHEEHGSEPIGYLMQKAREIVGVLLAIRSRRQSCDGAPTTVVNLSSWYVDPQYGWLAPRMLQTILAENADALITDLTPTEKVAKLDVKLGLRTWHEGYLRVALPLAALRPGNRQRLCGWENLDGLQTTSEACRVAEDHLRLGGYVAAIRDGNRAVPVVFTCKRHKGVPTARLVYCPSKALVIQNMGVIARFLLRRGVCFLRMPANRSDRVAGGQFSRRASATYCRGTVDAERIDHAYSEFVFFRF